MSDVDFSVEKKPRRAFRVQRVFGGRTGQTGIVAGLWGVEVQAVDSVVPSEFLEGKTSEMERQCRRDGQRQRRKGGEGFSATRN